YPHEPGTGHMGNRATFSRELQPVVIRSKTDQQRQVLQRNSSKTHCEKQESKPGIEKTRKECLCSGLVGKDRVHSYALVP
ncbi:MAG: hypothetical protein N3G20_05260, partial [Verrucomicrobiae bacterium]|nr:hypothetical protein [Verrucomicrobiae bacterium]